MTAELERELKRELDPRKALARLWMMIASGRSDLAKAEPNYQVVEQALARAQNPDGVRVVEVEDCGLCPCSTDLHLHSDLECDLSEEWKGYTEDGSPPDWCPLRSSPVLLRLKDGV